MSGILRICKLGHRFYKNSDCPTCPICEQESRPSSGFLSILAAPARRAVENEGINSLKTLSRYSEKEIAALHGMGANALQKLKVALKSQGLAFKKKAV